MAKTAMSVSAARLTRFELRMTLLLGGVLGVRMLGLFMLLPVLVISGGQYAGATPLLLGIALSIYGLTQAVFQVPFGWLSDKYGRPAIISVALALFVAGSIAAALADTIGELIAARAVQGSGAVGTVVMACIADQVSAEARVKANALVGMCIGAAFLGGLIIGPIAAGIAGVSGIFVLMAALGALAWAVCFFKLPPDPGGRAQHLTRSIAEVLLDGDQRRLFAGAFFLHGAMTACFMVLPSVLYAHLDPDRHWLFYLLVLIAAFIPVIPLLAACQEAQRVKAVVLIMIVLCCTGEFLLPFVAENLALVGLVMALFFFAFNVLEAVLPTLVSRACAPHQRGVAMGMLSGGQFSGTFAGGLIAGWGIGLWGMQWISVVAFIVMVLWLLVGAAMRVPP